MPTILTPYLLCLISVMQYLPPVMPTKTEIIIMYQSATLISVNTLLGDGTIANRTNVEFSVRYTPNGPCENVALTLSTLNQECSRYENNKPASGRNHACVLFVDTVRESVQRGKKCYPEHIIEGLNNRIGQTCVIDI